jgi:hypothetical protein
MVKLLLVDASDDKSFTEEGAFRVVTYNVIIHILHLFYYSDTLKKRLCLSFMGRILIKNAHSIHNQPCMFIVNSSTCSVKLLPHIWVFITIIINLHNRNFIWEQWIIAGLVKEMCKCCKSIIWISTDLITVYFHFIWKETNRVVPGFGTLICSSKTFRKSKILKMKVFSKYFSLYNFSWS